MKVEWMNKKNTFEIIDVRSITGNFLPSILNKARKIQTGEGLCVIQRFEPLPLYSVMMDMGFECHTEKVSETEYRAYFHRQTEPTESQKESKQLPLKPTAIVNLNRIDPELADVAVNFWNLIWGREEPAINMKTRLLLSLANGVGAGRFRQATRELVKGYSIGITTAELDELFAMFAWNQGVGYFASEIGPSSLFGAYLYVKKQEEKGIERSEIIKRLVEKFGEKNPDVSTFYKSSREK